MPKRGKKPKGDPSLFPYEGRPSTELTLGSFITDKALTETLSLSNDESTASSQSNKPDDNQDGKTSDCEIPGSSASEASSFSIKRTKKGKIPICLENRAKGKKVTVISNVTGDAEGLLTALKKRTGAGGVVRPGSIEIQGDHQVRISEFLSGHPCLKAWN